MSKMSILVGVVICPLSILATFLRAQSPDTIWRGDKIWISAYETIQNGKTVFVPGRWEIAPKRGGSRNNIPPPHYVPPGGYRTKFHDWATLSVETLGKFNTAIGLHQGVLGMDEITPQLSNIGMAPISVETIDPRRRPTHYPIDGYKRAHSGMLYRLVKRTGSDDDDVNYYIYPSVGSKYFSEYLLKGKTKAENLVGEIDVKSNFWNEIQNHGPKEFYNISLYGPWVHEKHDYWDSRYHDYLEVHPSENIWWTAIKNDRLEYNIGVFSDNSGRFNSWRPNPLKCLNAIAFEYTVGTPHLNYSIVHKTSSEIALPVLGAMDNAHNHVLKDGSLTILQIQEPEMSDFLSISFAKVSKEIIKGKTVYKGFILVQSTVRDGGHVIFSIREQSTPIISNPVTVEVTLNDIFCERVDDSNNDEDLFGSYGVMAVSGLRPVHANIDPITGDGTLWKRSSASALSLRAKQRSYINKTIKYTLPIQGDLILYGNLDETDGGFNADDYLGKPYFERFRVINLPKGLSYPVYHSFKSGGTVVHVNLSIKRLN